MTISATTQGLRPGVCTSTSRPSTPFDGMMIYETDTNLVLIWNGTAWKTLSYSDYTSGSVIQVASTTKTDAFSTTSTSFTDVTGLSATITPTSSSSKILITASLTVSMTYNAVNRLAFRFSGGNSTNYVGDSSGSRTRSSVGIHIHDVFRIEAQNFPVSMMYLDSPATTSATTYVVQMNVGAGTGYVNRSATDTDSAQFSRGASTITLMEIAA